MPDLGKLNRAIDEKGIKRRFIAGKMGISESTLSKKLNGKNEFTVSEANTLSAIIQLSRTERNDIFFESKVIC